MEVLGSNEGGAIVRLTYDELGVLTDRYTGHGRNEMESLLKAQTTSIEGKLKLVAILNAHTRNVANYIERTKSLVDELDGNLKKMVPMTGALAKGEEPAAEFLPPATPTIRRIMRNGRASRVRTSAMTELVINYCRKVDGVKKT